MLIYAKRNFVLRVNYEKFDVLFRNERLVQLSFDRIGSTTSKVYAELLRLLSRDIDRCRPDPRIDNLDEIPDDLTITTKQLFAALSPSIELSHGIGKVDGKKLVDKNFLKKMYRKRELARHAEAKAAAEKAEKEAKEAGNVTGVTIEVGGGEVVGNSDTNGNGHDDADNDEEGADSMNGDYDMNGNIPEVDEDESDALQDDPFADQPSSNKRSKVTFADDSSGVIPVDNRETQLSQLKDHLTLLAADEYCFVRQCGENGYGEWTVDFDDLVQRLKQAEIDSIVLENFGTSGHRLMQMMRRDGKIDEKNLPNTALLNQRFIRTKLAQMQMVGMAEVQGVPRDSAHTVNRMIFLWYFDDERVAEILLDNMYKVMSRHFERLDIERRRSSDIIALSERTDVKDGTEKLTDSQLSTLKEFRDKEDKLLGQIVRYDGLVGIFRDY
jgi:DNA-directed RNA polymerase III subunit RPC3